EIILSQEVQQAAEQGFINCLSKGNINRAIEIKDKFALSEEIILSQEVQQAAKQEFINCLFKGDINSAIEIKDNFSLPEEIILSQEVQQAAKQGFINCLSKGYINEAIEIKDNFSSPEEIILSQEVQQAAKQELINCLFEGYINRAIEIKDKFSLPEEIIQQATEQGFINCLSKGYINRAIEIKDKFSLPEEIIQQVAKQEFINCLFKGCINSAIKIKDKFALSEEIILSQEVQQAAKQGLINCLFEGDINMAIEIKDNFNFSISPSEIIEKNDWLKDLLKKLEKISPDFYNQAQKSVEIVVELCNFKNNPEQLFGTIKENPFLLNALSNNPRFGSKLLLKYPQLDELSQQNINFLFEAKKEISSQNSTDVKTPESLRFRKLMQEKLKAYENNPQILKAIEKAGIKIDQWLNYEETVYFNLESGDSQIAFSETIATPINRIKETIGSYGHSIKEVLKEYKTELSQYKISLESTKIEEKIAQMRLELEKARAEGDIKKIQGIEKGIAGLRDKINNIKTTILWDKLLGDISNFVKLKDDVFNAQEKLIQAENKLQGVLSDKTPSGKMIQELKQKLNKNKKELRDNFGLLEKKINDFRTNLPGLISMALGQDRADALIQEIEQRLAEQFIHYHADRSELAILFSEQSDKEKGKLENRPMSIFVWDRNPDIDLYQGNYSPCCICIDSAHMGAESTIADYNTDLGLQVINIRDETKNEPVTAAWCWLGKNKNHEAVLVVDNIESNTMYSANYSEQLTKELFEYIQNYAKAIGAKKVVLGKANNDLPTASALSKMPDDDFKYEKLGGYNREDGYFLEAKETSVKIIWETTVALPSKAMAAKKEKPTLKIEFKDIQTRNLTEDDFEKIKQLERKIYADTNLITGQAMIEKIKRNNGLKYSIIVSGEQPDEKSKEAIGYIVAIEDETDEGDRSVYLEDIAIIPEAQKQGIGWEMMKNLIAKLKEETQKKNKPVLLDMHLRENSQRFMEKYHAELEASGAKLIEKALVPNFYDEGEDALYKVYEVL
ncbi:MAG: GNAT family N-acetyltransferase, partial [Patescibacteria group bacterium]